MGESVESRDGNDLTCPANRLESVLNLWMSLTNCESKPDATSAKTCEIVLEPIKRTDPRILANMAIHYSQPKGFVGRNICYAVMVDGLCYGSIAGGSTTLHLPGRETIGTLNNGVNNIFYHVEKVNGKYPCRWFTVRVLEKYRAAIERDWLVKYGDTVLWHETLVELPRTGECYLRDGWKLVGQTKGFTCKRTGGKGSDSWGGKRVWDKKNLRPKHVFTRQPDEKQSNILITT